MAVTPEEGGAGRGAVWAGVASLIRRVGLRWGGLALGRALSLGAAGCCCWGAVLAAPLRVRRHLGEVRAAGRLADRWEEGVRMRGALRSALRLVLRAEVHVSVGAALVHHLHRRCTAEMRPRSSEVRPRCGRDAAAMRRRCGGGAAGARTAEAIPFRFCGPMYVPKTAEAR